MAFCCIQGSVPCLLGLLTGGTGYDDKEDEGEKHEEKDGGCGNRSTTARCGGASDGCSRFLCGDSLPPLLRSFIDGFFAIARRLGARLGGRSDLFLGLVLLCLLKNLVTGALGVLNDLPATAVYRIRSAMRNLLCEPSLIVEVVRPFKLRIFKDLTGPLVECSLLETMFVFHSGCKRRGLG